MKADGLLLTGAVLAGVSIADMSSAATQTVEASFIFDFVDASNPSTTQNVDLDPFLGTADQLTGVNLEFASRVFITESGSPSESLVIVTVDALQYPEFSPPFGLSDFTFDDELLGAGVDANFFVGGPVTLTLGAFDDEGSISGIWYAGPGIPFLGLEDFGGVTLTYEYDDVAASVPMPGSLSLAVGGLALLAGLRARRKGRTP